MTTDTFCQLPSTGGIAGLLIGLLFVAIGVALVVLVRRSRVRLSVLTAVPLLAVVGIQAPSATDPCLPASTVVPPTTSVPSTPTSENVSELPEETTVPPTTLAPTTIAPTTAPATTVPPVTTTTTTTTTTTLVPAPTSTSTTTTLAPTTTQPSTTLAPPTTAAGATSTAVSDI